MIKIREEVLRTAMLIGEKGISNLKNARVAVWGLGGVGGHVIEALVRSGIGAIDLIDNDIIKLSNLNRQIIATHHTLDMDKTIAMKERIESITTECQVRTYSLFYLPEIADQIPFREYDYIIDAIDTVTAKLDIVEQGIKYNVPVISCMGTGNKLRPELLEVADIYDTSVCPLAKVMRKECRTRGIQSLQVVYSKELPRKPLIIEGDFEKDHRRATPGSTAFVPATAGLLIASKVILALSQIE